MTQPDYAELELHPADPEPEIPDAPAWPRLTLVLLAGMGALVFWWMLR